MFHRWAIWPLGLSFFFISQICTFPWLFWFGGVFFFVVADTCAELDLWFQSSISCTVSFTAFMTFVSTPHQEQSRGRYTSLSIYPFNSYYISITQDYFILWMYDVIIIPHIPLCMGLWSRFLTYIEMLSINPTFELI